MNSLRFFLLSIILFCLPIFPKMEAASKIEALLLVDSESNLKTSVKKDGALMLKALKTIAQATKMELHCTLLQGDEMSVENIQRWFSSMHNRPHDVLFFYFSGHGCKSASSDIPWPYLFLSARRSFLSLENVIHLIEKEPCRLSLVLADCCNSTLITKHVELPFLVQGGSSRKKTPTYVGAKRLFATSSGHIRAIAAVRGQNARAYDEGSLFTLALLKSLDKSMKKPIPSWHEVFKVARSYCGNFQTPYASIDVRDTLSR